MALSSRAGRVVRGVFFAVPEPVSAEEAAAAAAAAEAAAAVVERVMAKTKAKTKAKAKTQAKARAKTNAKTGAKAAEAKRQRGREAERQITSGRWSKGDCGRGSVLCRTNNTKMGWRVTIGSPIDRWIW